MFKSVFKFFRISAFLVVLMGVSGLAHAYESCGSQLNSLSPSQLGMDLHRSLGEIVQDYADTSPAPKQLIICQQNGSLYVIASFPLGTYLTVAVQVTTMHLN